MKSHTTMIGKFILCLMETAKLHYWCTSEKCLHQEILRKLLGKRWNVLFQCPRYQDQRLTKETLKEIK